MGKFACQPLAEKLVNLEMGKWGNLPVGLGRRNWLIWKVEDCGLKIQYVKTLHKSLLLS
jgi:hypothetical protein